MNEKVIDRVFTELDDHSKRLVALSEVVHTNAGILGIVTKLVVGILLFIIITSLTALFNHVKSDPVLYHKKENSPMEHPIKYPGKNKNGGS